MPIGLSWAATAPGSIESSVFVWGLGSFLCSRGLVYMDQDNVRGGGTIAASAEKTWALSGSDGRISYMDQNNVRVGGAFVGSLEKN